MKPMGIDETPLDAAGVAQVVDPRQEKFWLPDEIVRPEGRYSIACVGCGIEMHLQMVPHKNASGLIVGWVFSCETCLPEIVGRRVWIADDKKR